MLAIYRISLTVTLYHIIHIIAIFFILVWTCPFKTPWLALKLSTWFDLKWFSPLETDLFSFSKKESREAIVSTAILLLVRLFRTENLVVMDAWCNCFSILLPHARLWIHEALWRLEVQLFHWDLQLAFADSKQYCSPPAVSKTLCPSLFNVWMISTLPVSVFGSSRFLGGLC